VSKYLGVITLFLLLITTSACTSVQSRPIFTDDDGALRGYDPVSYFDREQAVKGDKAHHYRYGGADFYFSSKENRQRFIDDPERFLPQYGGYCAYGMARNFVVSSDPNAFTVVDGKLYLNYSLKVKNTWLKDIPGNIAKADANWAKKLASKEKIEE
jgi:YHS domain-containing protein